jgi:small conductance mechanosensitive channel
MKEEIKTLQNIINIAVEFLVTYSFQILAAIIILIIGTIVARWSSRLVMRLCEKNNVDAVLTKFSGSATKIIVIIFVLIIALGKFGISIAPFIAALGALAFGASFALQGPLSNYGAGLMIIMIRPFTVGNTITIKEFSGVVEDITLSYTALSTEDGERITIPNKHIVGEVLKNSFENKVVETNIGISYQDNPQKAIEVINETLKKFPQISSEPSPQIGIEEFADSSINIGIRYWVPTKQYFKTQYEVNLAAYQSLQDAKITIPYPQRDVHHIEKPGSGRSGDIHNKFSQEA